MSTKNLDSLDELQTAINILNEFSKEKEAFSSTSLLLKTMLYTKHFFKQPSKKKQVSQALATLEKNRLLIESLKIGTLKQKQLAQSIHQAVDQFNFFSRPSKRLIWRRWMQNLNFETKVDTFSLSPEKRISLLKEESSKVNFQAVANDLSTASRQEIDAFRMKAITLLKHHAIKFSSLTDQLKTMREIPIHVKNEVREASQESIIEMHQIISPLPGETIELKGSFKRLSGQNASSVPIPESFKIISQSAQTGFPHHSQNHGWSLDEQWIEPTHPLFAKMQKLKNDLMPNGRYNEKAKFLLKLKTDAFNKNPGFYLNFHLQLDKAMMRVARLNEEDLLHCFYKKAEDQSNPYFYLSHILEKDEPFSILKKKLLELNKSYLNMIAEKQLENFIDEIENFDYINSNMEERLFKLLKDDILFWEKVIVSHTLLK